MPGLIGFTRNGAAGDRATLQEMQAMMRHQSFYVDDDVYCDERVCASRTHKNIVQREPQPYRDDQVLIWFKGEFCNQSDLTRTLGAGYEAASDPAILAALYGASGDFSFLKDVDGIYSAVIYDLDRKYVHLITDRYGFGYLYWTIQSGSLWWASEAKALLAHPTFEPRVNRRTVESFVSTGHPVDNDTWFEGVELVPPGTVLSWNYDAERMRTTRYWSWTDVPRIAGQVDFDEMVEELGRLWIDAVERRSTKSGPKVGVSLSGGLDSRAILAAIPDLGRPLHAVTIGDEHSDDVRIARRVAKQKGAQHHVYDLNEANWLRLRAESVWWSDGQFDVKHMHGTVLIDQVREYYDVNVSGIVGGPILGGSFLTRYDCDREEEARYLENRGRRYFPCHVLSIDDVFFHYRLPFMDNALVDFIMSVPDEARHNYRIYKSMLLGRFPQFYEHIPWQQTGLPIDASELSKRLKHGTEWVSGMSERVLRKLNIRTSRKVGGNKQFHDYDRWLRTDPARTLFADVLTDRAALYQEFIERDLVVKDWEAHLDGRNRAQRLCRYMTFETWLQQVFEGKYRHGWLEAGRRERRMAVAV